MSHSGLIWSGLGQALVWQATSKTRQLRVIVCPYIQKAPLTQLVAGAGMVDGLQIITRWTASDIASGVSDLNIFPWLQTQSVPLLIHPNIHLKLYVYDDGTAIFGSGNLTNRGMGWSPQANRELGGIVRLGATDWRELYTVLEESHVVDEKIYRKAVVYREQNRVTQTLPPLIFESPESKSLSLLDLPDAESIETLVAQMAAAADGSAISATLGHDLHLLGLEITPHAVDVQAQIVEAYRRLPLIVDLATWLANVGSASFGQVTDWLHGKCSSRPAPYRIEVKRCVAHLFTWLPIAFPGVEVRRPAYSQVLYWPSQPTA